MPQPAGLLYSKEHEWVKVEGDTATVGITDYAQHSLGDIVYVELPRVGAALAQFGNIGVVESVKAVSEVYSPVNGKVTAVNKKLQNNPEILNSDPHGDAWLIQVELTDRSEIDKLMTADEYEVYIQQEKAH